MSGDRKLKTRVKTAKKRKLSSTLWLERQINDPYVARAKKDGYRSRAAYKLLELDDKLKILKPGLRVLDLGAAPGGWSQVAAARCRSTPEKICVVAVDILDMPPIAGVTFLHKDFMDDDAPEAITKLLGGKVGLVLSDIAPNTTGHAATDHLRIMAILEAVFPFACEVLEPGGTFLAKVFQGGAEQELLNGMKRAFSVVRHVKPKASRADSAEMYVMATGFKGIL